MEWNDKIELCTLLNNGNYAEAVEFIKNRNNTLFTNSTSTCNMNYNADIAHCEGTECAIRDRCRRYQLHLMREKLQPIYVYSCTEPMYKDNRCEMFYPMNK